MAKRWRLEKKVDGNWFLEGVYSDNFIPQMGAAYARLAIAGLKPYEEIRVVEVKPDDS